MVVEDIVRIASDELELPWLYMWSISCCWEAKGSMSTTGVGFDFRNWEISSRRGHSFVKYSPMHSIHGYLDFLFPLSFSLVVGFGFSCGFPSFLFLILPLFFIIARVLNNINRINLNENLGSRRSRGGSLGLLRSFFYWQGLYLTNNPINRYFCQWICGIGSWEELKESSHKEFQSGNRPILDTGLD